MVGDSGRHWETLGGGDHLAVREEGRHRFIIVALVVPIRVQARVEARGDALLRAPHAILRTRPIEKGDVRPCKREQQGCSRRAKGDERLRFRDTQAHAKAARRVLEAHAVGHDVAMRAHEWQDALDVAPNEAATQQRCGDAVVDADP
jgi:hypothetical protein